MKLNKFLPVENLVYKTKLSKEQAIAKLAENIEAKKAFGLSAFNYSYSKPYIGKISGNIFEIERVIQYRNSFLPTIKGEVFSDYEGTKINVHMKPQSFVFVFMLVWVGGVTLGCIVAIIASLTQKFSPFFLIPFAMLLFGVGLFYGAFKSESSTSKKDLKRICEAEIV